MFLIVFNWVFVLSSHVSSQDLFCSFQGDQSRDVTHRLGDSVYFFQCTSFRVDASLFRLILLRLYVICVLRPLWFTATIITTICKMCAEALVVYGYYYHDYM